MCHDLAENDTESMPTKQTWHIIDSGATVGAALSNQARHLRDVYTCKKLFKGPSGEDMWSTCCGVRTIAQRIGGKIHELELITYVIPSLKENIIDFAYFAHEMKKQNGIETTLGIDTTS
jgi:hypothetical protein